ncbi:MAG: hypothetical protein WEB30_11260 [Cyclobacteriaceae bacterium]
MAVPLIAQSRFASAHQKFAKDVLGVGRMGDGSSIISPFEEEDAYLTGREYE